MGPVLYDVAKFGTERNEEDDTDGLDYEELGVAEDDKFT